MRPRAGQGLRAFAQQTGQRGAQDARELEHGFEGWVIILTQFEFYHSVEGNFRLARELTLGKPTLVAQALDVLANGRHSLNFYTNLMKTFFPSWNIIYPTQGFLSNPLPQLPAA